MTISSAVTGNACTGDGGCEGAAVFQMVRLQELHNTTVIESI